MQIIWKSLRVWSKPNNGDNEHFSVHGFAFGFVQVWGSHTCNPDLRTAFRPALVSSEVRYVTAECRSWGAFPAVCQLRSKKFPSSTQFHREASELHVESGRFVFKLDGGKISFKNKVQRGIIVPLYFAISVEP